MNRSKLADLSEIISSIAILITLVYLTIEISQNTNALNGQTRQAVLNAAQSELQLFVQEPRLVYNLAGSHALTLEEQIQLDSMLTIILRSREFSWLQYQDGTIDARQWDTELAVLTGVMESERVRLWWTRLGRQNFGGDFVGFVDGLLAQSPVAESVNVLAGTWANP